MMQDSMRDLIATLALLGGLSFCAVLVAGLIVQIVLPQKQEPAIQATPLKSGWGWSIVAMTLALGIFGYSAPKFANRWLQPEETSLNDLLPPAKLTEPTGAPSPIPLPDEGSSELERTVQYAPYAAGAISTVRNSEASGDAKAAVEDLRKLSSAVELLFLSKTLRLSDRLKSDQALTFDAGSAAKIHRVAEGIRSNCPTPPEPQNLTPRCRDYVRQAMPDLLSAGDQLRLLGRD